ncbi:response regulator receiver protein [Desulfovibrio sp. X2]|uniref:response regulator n=1 Tax=Desulfovibrio sp. X2 TaxID=941449 RepID=UPI0003587679|nr:response regulator [Desulfovibrio sp. X2]EPR37450.1 response regulator receiver protein [Desulfovibrio sp. X2]
MSQPKENWKILLVDDEEDFIGTLAERLTLRGLSPRVALDGEEALRLVEEEPPDVVVLDVLMPGMKGLDVLRAVKVRHPEIQVILLTGHGSTKDGMEGMRQGAFDYMMKPLSIDALLGKIAEAMEKAGKGG